MKVNSGLAPGLVRTRNLDNYFTEQPEDVCGEEGREGSPCFTVFSHVQLDVSAHLSALEDEEFFVIEGLRVVGDAGGAADAYGEKPPGCHTTAREPKRAHLRVPAFKNTTKIPREDPQREREKKSENGSGRGKKKSEILEGAAEGVRAGGSG